ncbi:hypothetical protein LMTR13_25775 [Bradyrhizobium icense]|uniref:Alanine dehydrogenase/pyridine nucleotide transhydrogenase NAD(H)-binding domain-containing protein n=1 Tax=Bradyrhizobium icense TaxID=1274631 RepID=A0A1B1UJW0_9BRAD|nr:hypothetical protein [Bradyrhizobium icense]ANW03050.1 hypothetical protein LMTR13_25775 [Bradyrhizobium icense]
MRQLTSGFKDAPVLAFFTTDPIEEEIRTVDPIIRSLLVPGASAPKLITREMLTLLRPGTVLVDVAIDQGGCFEASRATIHVEPTFDVDGIIHYCVATYLAVCRGR